MMNRSITLLTLLCLLASTAWAGKVGLAESATAFKVAGSEVGPGVSTLVATGDLLESGAEPVMVQSNVGSVLLNGKSRANLRDANLLELEDGALAVSLAGEPLSLRVGELDFTTIATEDAEGQRALAVKRDGEAVMIWSMNQPVAVMNGGEQIAFVGANDSATFVPQAGGSFAMTLPVMQVADPNSDENFDPTMPEEEKERRGFFWRFWGATAGSSTAATVATVGAATVVVVGGTAVATDNVPGQDDDSDDNNDDDDDGDFPPPPSSPTFP